MIRLPRLLFVFVACCCSVVAIASVPSTLNYQGYLTDPAGLAIDGDRTITFAIYNVDLGGAPLWSDIRTVAVDQGLFSIELGGPATPFPPGLYDNPLWIGIDVDSDGEMLPRRALTTVGFSFEADNGGSLGRSNLASGAYGSVSGGESRSVFGTSDWRAGTLFEGN